MNTNHCAHLVVLDGLFQLLLSGEGPQHGQAAEGQQAARLLIQSGVGGVWGGHSVYCGLYILQQKWLPCTLQTRIYGT
jgi:hypothetical protein